MLLCTPVVVTDHDLKSISCCSCATPVQLRIHVPLNRHFLLLSSASQVIFIRLLTDERYFFFSDFFSDFFPAHSIDLGSSWIRKFEIEISPPQW